jgi:hypothetical protein
MSYEHLFPHKKKGEKHAGDMDGEWEVEMDGT